MADFRLSVLDQSPVSEGASVGDALAQFDRPRPAGRPARLPSLLGGRAPRHARPGLRQPGSPDRPDRRRHRPHPRRQRRRHAAALQPVQSRRNVQHARRPLSRADRPRRRPGGRHRPGDRLRPAAGPPPGQSPTTSREQLAELLGYVEGTQAEGPVPGVRPPLRGARPAGTLAARLLAGQRGVGPPRPACRTPSPTSSTRPAARSPPATATRSRPTRGTRPRTSPSPPGPSVPRRPRKRRTWRPAS